PREYRDGSEVAVPPGEGLDGSDRRSLPSTAPWPTRSMDARDRRRPGIPDVPGVPSLPPGRLGRGPRRPRPHPLPGGLTRRSTAPRVPRTPRGPWHDSDPKAPRRGDGRNPDLLVHGP